MMVSAGAFDAQSGSGAGSPIARVPVAECGVPHADDQSAARDTSPSSSTYPISPPGQAAYEQSRCLPVSTRNLAAKSAGGSFAWPKRLRPRLLADRQAPDRMWSPTCLRFP